METKPNKLFRTTRGAYFLVMIAFCLAALIVEQYWLFAGELVCTLLAYILYLAFQRGRNRQIRQYLKRCEDTAERAAGGGSPFPAVLVHMGDKRIVWCSEKFMELTGLTNTSVEQPLEDVLEGLDVDWLLSGQKEWPGELLLNGRRYRVYGTMVRERGKAPETGVMYLTDLTELYQVRDEYIRSRPVVAILMVDNYEELTKNLSESANSTLEARINEAITLWAEDFHGLLRKMDRNRFLFVFEKRDLDRAVEDKFSLLDQVHEILSPSGQAASISIGLGVDGSCFEENYDFAALGIEMALSRGGDQAVIKDRLNFNFFGGRNTEADYSSKVRSRVTAGSLLELFSQSSRVFIMGHKNADLDCLGAAMGICCLCRKKGKKVNIIIDLEHNAAGRLIAEIRKTPEYADVFISAQDALISCDNKSTLVVVDTNRPDQLESKPLLEAMSRVCVVDHHRRAADYINPVVVNLLEPYASSASELAAELVMYGLEAEDVLPIEAKSMLAGICLDTKFFNVRTGERTFDAAAALRRMGADTTEVKILLQSDFQDTLSKYEIIRAAQVYRDELAIAAVDHTASRILAAQAADEMLNIYGITASFVLYQDDKQVVISARSIGKINVQVILEQLGGGGNAAVAGAQLQDTLLQTAREKLVQAIDQYYEK